MLYFVPNVGDNRTALLYLVKRVGQREASRVKTRKCVIQNSIHIEVESMLSFAGGTNIVDSQYLNKHIQVYKPKEKQRYYTKKCSTINGYSYSRNAVGLL